jgi:cyclophilin family peptidyl-prolyl cis-trans isomerase
MAKAQGQPAGTSGSQFFVVLADDAELRPNQAVLGEVVAGFDAVERIHLIGPPVDEGGPSIPVTIEKAVFHPSE